MAKRLEELEATWLHEQFRFEALGDVGDLVIGEAVWHHGDKGDRIVVKCNEEVRQDVTHPAKHRTYRFYGRWTEYTNPRTNEVTKQFQADTFTTCEPHNREGVIAYLDKVPGIGRVIAGELFKKFGSNAVKQLRMYPATCSAAVARLSDSVADNASDFLHENKLIEDCTIDLLDLTAGRKMPRRLVPNLIAKYGNKAAWKIRRNPFLLMQERGVGFAKADSLYLELGFPLDSLKRQALCAIYAIQSQQSGDTWFYHEVARQALHGKLSGSTALADKAIRLAVRAKRLECRYTKGKDGPLAWDGEVCWMSDRVRARQEAELARLIAEAMREPGWAAMNIDLAAIPDLTNHQREELSDAFGGGSIALLTGYAGTGKSFTLVRLLKHLLKTFTAADIAIAAPTGKAAVRIGELMGEAGISLSTSTMHSMLGVVDSDGDGWQYEHHAGNPLNKKLIVLDEQSMTDVKLMFEVMSARASGCLVLCLGDIAQLPPVGHGSPLRDMIAAGVPCGELTEIQRTAGGIVKACSLIRQGKSFEYGDNLKLVARGKPEDQKHVMLQVIDQISAKAELDPIWDFQVICSVNKNSPLNRKELNDILQKHLNPSQSKPGTKLKVRDKVTNTKNGWLPVSKKFFELPLAEQKLVRINESGRVYVANGDFGTVIDIQPKYYEVLVNAPKRIVVVPRTGGDGDSDGDDTGTGSNWELGYACTTHKCVHPETLVETPYGSMPIRKLQELGVVGTPCGPRHYQNRVYYENAASKALETRDGQKITVSNEHSCEVWLDGEWKMVPAMDVRLGQYVRTALFSSCPEKHEVILPVAEECDVRCKKTLIPTSMSVELAELLGLIVADGCVYKNGVKLGKRHFEVARRFSELCLKLFGVVNTEVETLGMLLSDCNSTNVRNWLMKLGGCFPWSKHVPECVMESSIDFHKAFLRGLFEDGTVNVKEGNLSHIEWSTVFPRLDREVRFMLHRIGIICGKNSQQKRAGQKRRNILLYIYGKEAKKFEKEVGFLSNFKINLLSTSRHGHQTRYAIPLSREAIEANSGYMTKSMLKNARRNKYISRQTATAMASSGCGDATEWLRWHYSPITSIEDTVCPVMCVEVPDGNRFMQSGFPWGNSQGSQFTVAVVILDGSNAAGRIGCRELIYTAYTRSTKFTYVIGDPSVAEVYIRRTAIVTRKTFLADLIHEHLWGGPIH